MEISAKMAAVIRSAICDIPLWALLKINQLDAAITAQEKALRAVQITFPKRPADKRVGLWGSRLMIREDHLELLRGLSPSQSSTVERVRAGSTVHQIFAKIIHATLAPD